MNFILASSSPRRKEILEKYHYQFEIIVSDIDESLDKNKKPIENAKMIGLKKCNIIADEHYNDIVLGCDTIVVLDDKIYGKPQNSEEAFQMLQSLSGKTHQVISGVGLRYKDILENFAVVSQVTFRSLSDEEIIEYIATKEPFGKAGAYAIQGLGRKLIQEYEGDLNNIIGLPMDAIKKYLDDWLSEE